MKLKLAAPAPGLTLASPTSIQPQSYADRLKLHNAAELMASDYSRNPNLSLLFVWLGMEEAWQMAQGWSPVGNRLTFATPASKKRAIWDGQAALLQQAEDYAAVRREAMPSLGPVMHEPPAYTTIRH